MNILSIGNSFSQDAQRYLHGIARADGFPLTTFNLYIGGCSLATHHRNMLSEAPAYTLEMNGQSTGFKVSLKEALLNRNWDAITLQQVSHCSTCYETYLPYLTNLVAYLRQYCPKAKLLIHQTWAYEKDSKRLIEDMKLATPEEMFALLKNAYDQAAAEICADGLIPAGALFQKLAEKGIQKIHRDTFHASKGLGRYALGLLWYRVLSKNTAASISFTDFDEEIPCEQIPVIQQCVDEVCREYGI